MATRAAPFDFDKDKQPANKRRKIEREQPAAFLDSLNDDCRLLILSYLPTDDLNTVAICSRRFREARRHESLDESNETRHHSE